MDRTELRKLATELLKSGDRFAKFHPLHILALLDLLDQYETALNGIHDRSKGVEQERWYHETARNALRDDS